MTSTSQLTGLAAEWRDALTLFPLYSALAREFVIDVPPCSDLEAATEVPPKESVEAARRWLLDVDERIQVHQLRQFLQRTTLASDDALKILLAHHLHKQHGEADRDKVDFLLVQYFSHSAPSGLQDADVDMEYVAQVLEPALGSVDLEIPDWLLGLAPLLAEAGRCKSLKDLLASHILDKGRKLKTSCGDKYYTPAAMVAFTRFSFLMRRVFFRLMHQDLNAILDGLRELEASKVETLDCRKAQFSAEEPLARLRMICQSWKVMFHAEYSYGQPLQMLVDLRAVVENAIARSSAGAGKAAAARAGAHGDALEFEVSADTHNWNSDTNHDGKP
jgi:hypothetical protein